MLVEVADRAVQRAEKKPPGALYDELTAILFSALAIEALSNAIGDRVVADWSDYESARPLAKLRILTSSLSVPFDRTKEPWVTARWLFRFRNAMAHAKPEFVTEETVLTAEEADQRLFDRPLAKMEKEISLANAKRALEACRSIHECLCGRVPAEMALGLSADGWSGKMSEHSES